MSETDHDKGVDGQCRCPWAGTTDPVYIQYHDTEWGVPVTDDRRLFEKVILEGFQSGLSWITILRKRDNFRRAFRDFDAEKIARFTAKDVERLMNDVGIIRNRLKIEAAITNARAYLLLREQQTYASFLWSFVEGKPVINAHKTMKDVPAETELSKRISKDLKRRGFKFVGPTTIYANIQSIGLVNDHLVSCHRYLPCAKLQRVFKMPK
jgi:DNA-3-methyladenine glycosylase I